MSKSKLYDVRRPNLYEQKGQIMAIVFVRFWILTSLCLTWQISKSNLFFLFSFFVVKEQTVFERLCSKKYLSAVVHFKHIKLLACIFHQKCQNIWTSARHEWFEHRHKICTTKQKQTEQKPSIIKCTRIQHWTKHNDQIRMNTLLKYIKEWKINAKSITQFK